MVRVKRAKSAKKRRKHLLKKVKGFRWSRKSKYRLAKQALMKAQSYMFRDRKRKKREFRRLWQTKISLLLKNYGINYSKFIYQLKKKNIKLNRKILAQLAQKHPKIFEKIIKEAVSE